LLGSFQASLDGSLITTFETHKVRALLAYLAVEADRPHTRDELVGLLWPEQPDQAARASLRQALASLRKSIGDRATEAPFLLTAPDSIQFQLSSDCWIDCVTFSALIAACQLHTHRRLTACGSCAQRLQQAVELYHGDFLAQFVQDGEAFEEWVLVKRERLHRAALDALYALAEYHDRRGEYDRVRQYAMRQLELDPWREEAHRQMMRALALSGQRSAALAQYEACRRVLKTELGVEPTRDTLRLYEHIRDGSVDDLSTFTPTVRLPAMPTPLVGREREIAELVELIENPAHRLVTIAGTGGIGKTRLAIAAAGELAYAFKDGVTFVSLAALDSVEFLAATILTALGGSLDGQVDATAQLHAYLHSREMLLILDNWEHLLPEEGGVELLAEMLHRAPGLTVLATSRERLGIQAEWLVDLQGLDYPQGQLLAELETFGAIQLFMQRARQAQRGVPLAQADLSAIARICQLVEGLPLAIELAAASVGMRSCAEIAAEIQIGAAALTSRFRDAPARQRSVRATFEHSWNLLSEQERCALQRVSVFRGGWQVEAAAQVAGASLGTLTALVDKSLLRCDGAGRFDMHELVRQYACDKLIEAHEEEQINSRHLDYFAQVAEAAEPGIRGAEQITWLKRLEADLDNVRAALAWSASGGDAEWGLRLAGALWRFWFVHGHLVEGRQWLDTLLAQTSTTMLDPEVTSVTPEQHRAIRATALPRAAYLTFLSSNIEAATVLADEGLALSRQVTDRAVLGFALIIRGAVALLHIDMDQAQALYEEALAILGNETEHKWHMATTYYRLGILAEYKDDYVTAEIWLEKSLTLFRELGDRISYAAALQPMGEALRSRNDVVQAIAVLQECSSLYQELGVKGHLIINVMDVLGTVHLEQGDLEQASMLFQDCLTQSRDMGHTPQTSKALHGLAIVALYQHDSQRAKDLLEESLAIMHERGARRDIVIMQQSLGDVTRSLGECDRALNLYRESLMLVQHLPDMRWEISEALRRIAPVLSARGQHRDAARLFGASDRLRDETNSMLAPLYRPDYERTVNDVRDQLGEAAFQVAWDEGRAMTHEQAIQRALQA
jgi:predicted ATPase/DNA-binding SARP family transcriptional activator